METNYTVGQAVEVFSFGRWYRGTVAKVGRARCMVTYTTGTGTTRVKAFSPAKIRARCALWANGYQCTKAAGHASVLHTYVFDGDMAGQFAACIDCGEAWKSTRPLDGEGRCDSCAYATATELQPAVQS